MARHSRHFPVFLVVVALATGLAGTHAAAESSPSDHDDDEQTEEDTMETENLGSVDIDSGIGCSPLSVFRMYSEYDYQVTGGEIDKQNLEASLDSNERKIGRCEFSFPRPETDEDEDSVEGDVVVELTIRDEVFNTGRFAGGLTKVELVDSDFDDESEGVECVLDELQKSRVRFPPPEDDSTAVVTEVKYQIRIE